MLRPTLNLASLTQARELEIGVRWRDWRQLCGVAFLRLEDFLDNACHQLSLSLVPQGLLFAQVPSASCLLTLWAPGSIRAKRAFETVAHLCTGVETEAQRQEVAKNESHTLSRTSQESSVFLLTALPHV